jgi:hypothetical protein
MMENPGAPQIERAVCCFKIQPIYLAPIDSRVIFGQDRIVKLDGNFFAVSRDVNNTLVGMGIPEHYDVYSLINMASAEELRRRRPTYSENVKRYYTKLTYRDPRIDNLAQEITKNASTVYDQAMLVQNFLEKNYRYTTVNLPQSSTDPVSTFLFSKKMGHCEYFATSMVILLRHLGIPSRLVNGFLEGEYNEIGDFYIVRQSDAHTWVEVYFGNGLWVTFDPSPRDLGAGGASGSFWHFLNPRKILDSISFFWDRYILIFSAQDQIDILSTIRDRYRDVNRKLREKTGKITNSTSSWRMSWEQYRYPIVFVALFVLMLYAGHRFRKQQRWRMELIRSPILFYQQMLLQLQRKGLEKRPATTPAEFVDVVALTLPSASDDVASITSLFYKARFGNYVLSMEDQALIQSALSRLSRNP